MYALVQVTPIHAKCNRNHRCKSKYKKWKNDHRKPEYISEYLFIDQQPYGKWIAINICCFREYFDIS